MGLTFLASSLNSIFASFDQTILTFMNVLANNIGFILTPLARIITLIGEKGAMSFLLSIILMCFSKTRKAGICMFGAICCGTILTSFILKDAVARPRPFQSNELYISFWKFIGSPAEDGFSFPSGHVTAAAAAFFAILLSDNRKLIIPTLLYLILMGFSRNYLMAHYPSDVLFGTLSGALSSVIAYPIASAIWKFYEKRKDKSGFANFIIERNLFSRK